MSVHWLQKIENQYTEFILLWLDKYFSFTAASMLHFLLCTSIVHTLLLFKWEHLNEFSFLVHEELQSSIILAGSIFRSCLLCAIFVFLDSLVAFVSSYWKSEHGLLQYIPHSVWFLNQYFSCLESILVFLLKHTCIQFQFWTNDFILGHGFLMQSSIFPRILSCLNFGNFIVSPQSKFSTTLLSLWKRVWTIKWILV